MDFLFLVLDRVGMEGLFLLGFLVKFTDLLKKRIDLTTGKKLPNLFFKISLIYKKSNQLWFFAKISGIE
jgi:hypothetical protein